MVSVSFPWLWCEGLGVWGLGCLQWRVLALGQVAGLQGACKGSAGVWSTSARSRQCHGLVSPCVGGSTPPQGGPRLLGCTIMWGELAHVGRYDLHFRESQEPQGPLGEAKCSTPKQQAWGILGRLGAASLVLSLCVDNWHGMQHMEICSSARLLLQPF